MADGNLKLLNMYSKVVEMTQHLSRDPNDRGFFNMEYLRLCQQITALNAAANRLYGSTANGNSSGSTTAEMADLQRNYLELHAGLSTFRNRYMSQTSDPNGPMARMLQDLENDVVEDRTILRDVDLQPGTSMKLAVYNAQKAREQGLGGQEQELPGYDEVHGMDYPGQNTLYGGNTQTMQQTGLPPQQFPSMDTLRMQNGGVDLAVQPYERQFYGTNTFYQNQELPGAEEVGKQSIQYQRKNGKYLQIWTIGPLTDAIISQTKQGAPEASRQMYQVNHNLLTLFNTVYPFNPKLGEQPRVPGPQDLAGLKAQYENAYNGLRQWKEAYCRETASPSSQVLFMTDNVMKKLEDDYQVINGMQPGRETLPEAALKKSKLAKHFGLENDRKTPTKCPEEVREEAAEQVPEAAPEQAAPAEERVPRPEELYKAFFSLQGIQDSMVKADPKWMLSSSGAFGEMRKSVEGAIKYVLKHRDVFSSTPDPESEEYKKAAKEFMRRLNDSKNKTASYLDKKASDFAKETGRAEDPGRQKWEQTRILTALTSYDTLSEICSGGNAARRDAETDARVENYRQTLTSEKSKEKLASEAGGPGNRPDVPAL